MVTRIGMNLATRQSFYAFAKTPCLRFRFSDRASGGNTKVQI